MTLSKQSAKNKGIMEVLTEERSLWKEVEAIGLFAFFVMFLLGPLSASVTSASAIVDSYKVTYNTTVDQIGDMLIDATDNRDSLSAAVLRGVLNGNSEFQASSTMPHRGDMEMRAHASSTPEFGDRHGDPMGGQMFGQNNEDATSTRTVQMTLSPADIKTLQQFLNMNGFNITQSGEGSAGNETTSFGPKTVVAFRKFLQSLREHSHGGNGSPMGGMGSSTPRNNYGNQGMRGGDNSQN